MRLLHYSHKETLFEKYRKYDQSEVDYHCKPNGLWVSVEGNCDWNEWCKSEKYGLYRLRFRYEINLKPDANILYLKTPGEIFYFSKKYAKRFRPFPGDGSLDTHELDWFQIKETYQGIIIDPYQWDCRLSMESSWYYGWDCSSGCIWDLDCIESFTFLGEDSEAPTEPDKKPCISEIVKNSLTDSAKFLSEDGHEEHEYDFAKRSIFTSIQYLESKRRGK